MPELERLIELVKARRFLYDLNDAGNKNRHKKTEAWNEIADEMGGCDGPITWSSKWNTLRGNYFKYKKANDPTSGPAFRKYKNWPWAEHMKFLDDFNCFGNRRTGHNINTRNIQTQEDQSCNFELFIPDAHPHSTTDEVHDPLPETSENLTPNIKKRKLKSQVEEPLELDHKMKRYDSISNLDGVDHFFLSYAQSFKNLPSRIQIMLKLEIATLFSQYELRAQGLTSESINMSRIVPHPFKSEYDCPKDDD